MEAVKKTLANVTLGGQVIPVLAPFVNPCFFQVYTVKVNHAAMDARSMDSAETEHASVNRGGMEGGSCNRWGAVDITSLKCVSQETSPFI